MKVEIPIHEILIKDKGSGEGFTVKTLRTAEDIANYIEESEKEELIHEVENAVSEALS